MDADWSVELGCDDPVLEFPWAGDDGLLAYVDLKKYPERITEISEARDWPELAKFLLDVNSASSQLLTAKCDAWQSRDLEEAEEVYHAKMKFCCYVDLLFAEQHARRSFDQHEGFVKSVARGITTRAALCSDDARRDDLPAAAEFIVRRCWFHDERVFETEFVLAATECSCELQEGFYVTFYLCGYGAVEEEARSHWRLGLKDVSRVLARMMA